ncbi:NAD dependent epimerase/dehydratase family protein [Chaetomium strumarium]|uniref:NAD dependent epimerase/dehydratase family protein n=1 Tax=Chaetomium strumarium TaxID=1170767 RepID=A0AAJ0M6P7_9PEZI|nr:NAD dependent epimerase/dehydratase family protein [Chaetomium strumarium]
MSKPTVLVTGSAGHLGKALMLALPDLGYTPIGIDINASPTTTFVGSITDTAFLSQIFSTHSISHVIHAATLHKPHVGSHSKNDFIQTNIAGTLALLEAASSSSSSSSSSSFSDENVGKTKPKTVESFIYISTTSTFGSALSPSRGQPAAWIDESVVPVPKNIYGVTKTAAEDVCRLVHRETGLPVIVLRTSRFFPEEDDDEERRSAMEGENLKVLELAYRRVDIADVVSACVCAMERAARHTNTKGQVRWGKYIISAPTPFGRDAETLRGLDEDAAEVFKKAVLGCVGVFERKGWRFLDRLDRVYDSTRAVEELGWKPEYTFEKAVEKVGKGEEWRSPLTFKVGKLGYHAVPTGVYTTREEATMTE